MKNKVSYVLNDNKELTVEDLETLELLTKKGTSSENKSRTLSFRTTERFLWGVELYRRVNGTSSLSDSQVLEDIFWNHVKNENPFLPKTSTPSKAKFIKFFMYKKEGNQKEYKFTSLIELTWSKLEIFRIIKLGILEKDLLKDNEKMVFDYIMTEKAFWFQKEKIPKPISIATGFEGWNGKNIENSFLNELLNLSTSNYASISEKISKNMNSLKAEDYNNEISRIKEVLKKNTFEPSYFFGGERIKESKKLELEVFYFPLEYLRILELGKKMCELKFS